MAATPALAQSVPTATPTPATSAAAGIDPEDSTTTVLDPVFVTATPGREERVRDVQASVEVIGPDRMNAVPPTSTMRALEQAQGLLAIDGSSNTTVTIRGFQPGQALILVDGQRRRGRFGFQDLANIDPTNIERIEVIRGPLSALYGADAVAGVINIITKRPSETMGAGLEAMFGGLGTLRQGESGQRNTMQLGLWANTGTIETPLGPVRGRFALSGIDRGSWSAAYSQFDDLKTTERRFAAWSGMWDIAPGHSLQGRFEWQNQADGGRGSNGQTIPRATNAYERQEDFYGAATYAGDLGSLGTVNITGSAYASDAATRRAAVYNSTYIQGQELNAYWNLQPLEGHRVTLGANALHESIDLNSITTGSKSRSSFGLVAQDQWTIAPDWSLLAGIRFDSFSTFGSTTNPRASLQWTPGPWTFRIGGGTAFRAPSFQELYTTTIRGRAVIYGSPNLEPEKSTTVEATIGRRIGDNAEITATYFRANVDNLITYIQTNATTYVYQNVNEARIQGVELGGTARVFDQLTLRASLDWNDATNAQTGARLTQRARYIARAGAYWQATEKTTASVFVRALFDYYAGSTQNPNLNPVNKNYARLDVRVDHRFTPNLAVYAGIDGLAGNPVPVNISPLDPPGRFFYTGLSLRY
jgi:outer membrane receptor for ferrienterochelin and colicins